MTWRECRLGDVMRLQRGHDLPADKRLDGDVPVVSSSGITGFHNESKAQPPGVVTGRYGTLGEVYFLDRDYWPLNTALYVTDFKGNDPKFTSYFLKHVLKDYQSDKAAVPGVDRNVVHEIKVRAPDTLQQKRIAQVLSDYDDLIDNNRRRIKLLQDSVRLLFDEWFVRLRFPGHERLPAKGALPNGWSHVPLGSLTAKNGSGATPRGGESAYVDAGIALIRSQNVYDFNFVDDGLAYINVDQAARLDGVAVEHNDILLNITGASVARCCMVPQCHLPARVNQHVMIIRADQNKIDPYYLLCAINSEQRKRQLLSYAQTGSTREALTKDLMSQFEFVLPDATTLRAFGQVAAVIFQQREVLAEQVTKLKSARDLLLPRLMSGALVV